MFWRFIRTFGFALVINQCLSFLFSHGNFAILSLKLSSSLSKSDISFKMSPIYNCELVQNVRHIPILISSALIGTDYYFFDGRRGGGGGWVENFEINFLQRL